MRTKYSKEQVEFIKNNIHGTPYAELTRLLNLEFNTNITISSIKGKIRTLGLKNGLDGKFKPGCTQICNNAKSFIEGGMKTRFKKGQPPINYRPVGSERINVDGYIEVKVEDPGKWRLKQIVKWEKLNGPLPKGFVLVFLDQNKLNINLDNLKLVSRRELLAMNRAKLFSKNKDLTNTGINFTRLSIMISDKENSKKD